MRPIPITKHNIISEWPVPDEKNRSYISDVFEGRKDRHYLRTRQTEGSGLHSLQILYWRFLLMARIKILFFLGSLNFLFTFVSVSSVLPLIVKAIMLQNFESYYVSPCLRVLFVATGKALLSSDGQIQPAKEDDYGEF